MDTFLQIENYDQIKSLWENNAKETINLEFKSELDSNNNEIAKDVSSMANAEGGLIAYGVGENSENGTAIHSEGIDIAKKDERIQQIVNSTISPHLQIGIKIIKEQKESDKGFMIVTIPKSELYIHQVNTIGKFYIRTNTTTKLFKFEPITLPEAEIALRYQKRFENKARIEDSIDKKLEELTGKHKTKHFFFLSAIPHVLPGLDTKITKQVFNRLITRKQEGSSISTTDFYYNFFTDSNYFFDNRPTGSGRFAQGKRKQHLEIKDDGSIFFFKPIPEERDWYWWDNIYAVVDFLHLITRFYSMLNYYGGILVRCQIAYTFPSDADGNIIPHLDPDTVQIMSAPDGIQHSAYMDIKIEQNIQIIPFNLRDVMLRIFDKWFETLGVDNPREYYSKIVNDLEKNISNLESQFSEVS